MSKWNRNLGFLESGQVQEALQKTIPARPTDEEIENAPPEPVKHRNGVDYLPGHYRDLVARRNAHDDVDETTKSIAVDMAEAGLKKLGVPGHVHVTAATRIDGDPTSPNYGDEVMVVAVTVTRYTGRKTAA